MRVHVYPILIISLELLVEFSFYILSFITKTSHTIITTNHTIIDDTTDTQKQYNYTQNIEVLLLKEIEKST